MSVRLPKKSRQFKHAYWQDSFDAVDNAVGLVSKQALFYVFCAVSFLVPFSIAQPQLLVGTIVNAALVAGAFKLRGGELLPLIVLPSLGTLAAGLVFGPFTPFLVVMLPFIWIGNALLVYAVKRFIVAVENEKNKTKNAKNYVVGNAIGIAAKTAFLFASAYALYSLQLVPAIFLTAFGVFQLVTALAGAGLAFALLKSEPRIARLLSRAQSKA